MVRTLVCHTKNRSSILLLTAIWLISLVVKQELCNLLSEVRFFDKPPYASVAQLVEQRTENPCRNGSIPFGSTNRQFEP